MVQNLRHNFFKGRLFQTERVHLFTKAFKNVTFVHGLLTNEVTVLVCYFEVLNVNVSREIIVVSILDIGKKVRIFAYSVNRSVVFKGVNTNSTGRAGRFPIFQYLSKV